MARLTQMIEYLNVEKHPSFLDVKHKYTHFTIDNFSKEIRKKYRAELKLPDNTAQVILS